MTHILKLLPLLAVFFMTGFGTQSSEFIVKGVSGNDVLLDRIWDRGCIPGFGGNDWTEAHRTLTGLELVTTMVDYQNGSTTPDCAAGRVGISTFTTVLTNDGILVPIVWVDAAGNPAAAPAGLEEVTEANGASGVMTVATVTPETQPRADQLNQAAFCGFTDWAPNVAKDTVACFTGGVNPARGTIVVDDTTLPWKIYDGIGLDPNEYPTQMPNYLPHSGPFDSL